MPKRTSGPPRNVDFLADVSHELRTPLYGVLGMTDLALDEPLPPLAREYLQAARGSAQRLLRRLDDLLDYAVLAANQYESEPQAFRVRGLVDQVLATLEAETPEAERRLGARIEADVPDAVTGDARTLQRILTKLLGHVLRSRDRGAINLTVATLDISLEAAALSFEISSNNADDRRTPEGRTATERSAKQSDGEPPEQNLGRQSSPKPSDEGSEVSRGLDLTLAGALARRIGARIKFPKPAAHTGVVCALQVIVARDHADAIHTSRPAAEADGTASTAVQVRRWPRATARVLLAEDTPANQKIVTCILSKHGYQVEVARNGREVVEKLTTQPFDIVLMDLQMPTMDGLQATTAIRASHVDRVRQVPIVALTAHAMPDDRARCLTAGMNAYLAKPIDADQLVATVQQFSPDSFGNPPRESRPLRRVESPTAQSEISTESFAPIDNKPTEPRRRE